MEELTLERLLAGINSDDADVRTQAWLAAGAVGAPAVKPLAALMTDTAPVVARLAEEVSKLRADKAPKKVVTAKQQELEQPLEVGRAAKRAIWKIVRHVGRPGADDEKKAVVAELIELLGPDQTAAVRREAMWMLSEIGGDETVHALRQYPEILDDKELREDARCVVERIPGEAALQALRAALDRAPEDFKINIVQSLRARGVDVPGYPCQKLVPTRKTSVKPAGR